MKTIALFLAALLGIAIHDAAAANVTLYQTSFEAPAFTPGLPIRGQDNWEMYHDGEAISVSTNNARAGLQCLRFEGALLEQSGPNSVTAYCFSRALESLSNNPPAIVEITASVRLDGPQTGTNGTPEQDILSANLMAVVPQGTGFGELLGGFFVSSAGKIWTYSRVTADNYLYSVPYTLGTYRTLTLRVDFIARRLTWIVDGVQLGTRPFLATITADRLASGYLYVNGPLDPINTPELTYAPANYTAYFDDYSLVSVPLSPVNAIIEFASTNILADEFMATAKINVARRGFTGAAVRVTVSTTNGTAIAGEDYEAISTFVTFAAGETNKVVEVPLKDDYFAEPDKAFTARITGLPPGATSPKSTASVRIRDDERPGSIDQSWSSTLGLTLKPNEVLDLQFVAEQPDGHLVWIVNVVLNRDPDYPTLYSRVVRILPDGSVDGSFPFIESSDYYEVTAMADGKLLVASRASEATSPMRLNYRLNLDGSRDTNFTPVLSGSIALNLIPQPDGRILVNGAHPQSVMMLNGQSMPQIFRLHNDGTRDTNFNGPAIGGTLRLLTNGQLYLQANDAPPYRLYRLNPNGSIDPSFNPPANLDLNIRQLLSNGQILTTSYPAQSTKLYRLNQDGSLDDGFTIGTAAGTPNMIGTVIVQSDGKVIVGGAFRTYNGQVRNSIVRLNSDGSIDLSFQTGQGFLIPGGFPTDVGQPYQLWLLSDDRILVGRGGGYELFDGEKVTPPIILNPDGRRDREFEGTLFDGFGEVSSASPIAVMGGIAYFANGYGIGRLRMNLPLRIVSTVRETNGTTRLTSNALTGRSYTLQTSETLTNWTDLATQSATTNRIEFTDTPTNSPAMRLYRVKQD